MSPSSPSALRLYLATALALSIGWGIRGNFGHEFGALLPGALASMAAVLMSGRKDWQPRVVWAGLLGALGWSFGGSISYMQVIAYTCSGHSPTIAYGFFCLFVIGFLWAATGGAGLGLSVELPRARLLEVAPMLAWVGVAWGLQTIVEEFVSHDAAFRHEDPLYWYDTDWLAAAVALATALLRVAWRRRWDTGSSMVAWMACGWWAGFLGLVVVGHLRMTPPRGDNWAGCLGMVAGLGLWLWRSGWRGSLLALLRTGAIGGVGFSGAALLQLIEAKSGLKTNWHSILEQSYGFINGLGVAWAAHRLRTRLPEPEEAGDPGHFWHLWALLFVLVGIPWLNLQRCVETWVDKGMPATLHGIPTIDWFHASMVLLLGLVGTLGRRHLREPLALMPQSWNGRGQLALLALLAFMVAGNFTRALPGFQAERLVTEGTIQFNALLLAALLVGSAVPAVTPGASTAWGPEWRRAGGTAVMLAAALTVVPWAAVLALYGNQKAPVHSLHIRFGPNKTATDTKPKAGQPHP